MADTDISLSVGLDVRDAEKTAKDLQKEVRKIFESRNGEQSAAITNLELQMKKTYEAADLLQHKMEEMRNMPPVRTQAFEELDNEFDRLSAKYEQLSRDINDAAMANTSEDIMNKMVAEIDEVGLAMDRVMAQRDKMLKDGTAFIPPEETEAYIKAQQDLDLLSDKMKQQIIRHTEMTDREIENYERIQAAADNAGAAEQARQMKTEQSEMRHGFASATRSVMGLNLAVRGIGRLIPGVSTRATSAIASASRGLIRLASLTKNDLIGAVKSLGAVIMKLLTALMSHPAVLAIIAALSVLIVKLIQTKKMMDSLAKVFKSFAKEALEFLKTIPRRLANLAKLVFDIGTSVERFFIKGVTALIQKLSSLKGVVSENLKYMVQWNKGVNDINKSMSNLTSSVAYLKGSITTIIAPILNSVEPVLTKITDRLAEVATSVGMFIAQLTGQSKFQRAIREQKDYAEALRGTNEQLASFDKLNVINDSKGGEDDFPIKFEEVDVEPLNLHILEELFEKAQSMAEKFTKAINSIPWDDIKQGAEDAAYGISNLVNGITGTNGIGSAVGTALGEVINTVRTFFDGIFDERTGIDFQAFGEQMGDFFTDAIDTVDWKAIGKTIWDGFRSALKAMRGFLKKNPGKKMGKAFSDFLSGALGEVNLNWNEIDATLEDIVSNIADFLNEIITPENFKEVGTTLGNVMNSVVTAAKTFANDVHWSEWGDAISTAINNFFSTWNPEWTADAINKWVTGLEDMLYQAITGIEWDNVSDKIVTFLSEIDWKSIGDKAVQISQELREGLKKVWEELKRQGVVDDIMSVVVDLFNEYKQWVKFFKQIKREVFWKAFDEWLWGDFDGGNNTPNGPVVNGSAISYGNSNNTTGNGVRYLTKQEMWELTHPGQGYAQTMADETLEETKKIADSITETEKFILRIWEELGSDKFKSLTGVVFGGDLMSLTYKQKQELYTLLKQKGYASGTVIPPSASEFLAKVGDNNRETEVISPLSTIKQALMEAMAEQNINVTFQVEGDPEGIFKIVQREARTFNRKTGSPAFAGGR